MKLGIVILHFRSLENTQACLKSVCDLLPVQDLEAVTIVVDNGSDEIFLTKPPSCSLGKIEILRNKKNKGFSGGMNTGISYALENGCDYVLTVNNDTVFDKSFLKHALEYIRHTENAGVFVPKIYFYPGSEYHYERYKPQDRGKVIWFAGGKMDWKNLLPSHIGVDQVDNGQFDKQVQMDFATGCCMIYSREILESLGTFDDRYFLYFEDVDLSLRYKRAGKKLVFMPRAILWHKNAKSTGGAGSTLQDYFSTRNRLLLGMRYASMRTKFALLRESLRLLFVGRQWQKKGVIDFYLRKFGIGSYPI